MAEWLKASYGSDKEEPTSFEEALQSDAVPNIQPLQQQQQQQQQQAMPTLEGLNIADEVSRFGTACSEWYTTGPSRGGVRGVDASPPNGPVLLHKKFVLKIDILFYSQLAMLCTLTSSSCRCQQGLQLRLT